jgi:hypothetical protein
MRIFISGVAALALAFAGVAPAFARPCNDVSGCVVRAEFCRVDGAAACHVERLFPEPGVGLCTMAMMPAAVQWIVGDEASGKPPHPGFRLKATSCVTPDEADL